MSLMRPASFGCWAGLDRYGLGNQHNQPTGQVFFLIFFVIIFHYPYGYKRNLALRDVYFLWIIDKSKQLISGFMTSVEIRGYPSYWRVWIGGAPMKTAAGYARIFSGLDTAIRMLERSGHKVVQVEVAR